MYVNFATYVSHFLLQREILALFRLYRKYDDWEISDRSTCKVYTKMATDPEEQIR